MKQNHKFWVLIAFILIAGISVITCDSGGLSFHPGLPIENVTISGGEAVFYRSPAVFTANVQPYVTGQPERSTPDRTVTWSVSGPAIIQGYTGTSVTVYPYSRSGEIILTATTRGRGIMSGRQRVHRHLSIETEYDLLSVSVGPTNTIAETFFCTRTDRLRISGSGWFPNQWLDPGPDSAGNMVPAGTGLKNMHLLYFPRPVNVNNFRINVVFHPYYSFFEGDEGNNQSRFGIIVLPNNPVTHSVISSGFSMLYYRHMSMQLIRSQRENVPPGEPVLPYMVGPYTGGSAAPFPAENWSVRNQTVSIFRNHNSVDIPADVSPANRTQLFFRLDGAASAPTVRVSHHNAPLLGLAHQLYVGVFAAARFNPLTENITHAKISHFEVINNYGLSIEERHIVNLRLPPRTVTTPNVVRP